MYAVKQIGLLFKNDACQRHATSNLGLECFISLIRQYGRALPTVICAWNIIETQHLSVHNIATNVLIVEQHLRRCR